MSITNLAQLNKGQMDMVTWTPEILLKPVTILFNLLPASDLEDRKAADIEDTTEHELSDPEEDDLTDSQQTNKLSELYSTTIPSVDSAMESWDGSGLDAGYCSQGKSWMNEVYSGLHLQKNGNGVMCKRFRFVICRFNETLEDELQGLFLSSDPCSAAT